MTLTASKRAVCALVFWVAGLGGAWAEPPEKADDVKLHLEFLGYEVSQTEKSLLAKHSSKLNLLLKKYAGGILITSYFGGSEKAKASDPACYKAINALNANAVVARYYIDNQSDIIIETVFPGTYERVQFGGVLEKFNLAQDQIFDGNTGIKDCIE